MARLRKLLVTSCSNEDKHVYSYTGILTRDEVALLRQFNDSQLLLDAENQGRLTKLAVAESIVWRYWLSALKTNTKQLLNTFFT